MRAFTALIGPAGRRALARFLPVAHRLRAAGARVSIEYPQTVDQARDLARAAARRDEVIVAAGGDGTVRCLGGALAETGGLLGIVPAGRGNDFARQLHLPQHTDAIADLLLHAPPRYVDVLDAGGDIIMGSVYTGVDAAANVLANESRLIPAGLVYPVAGLRALLRWRPTRYAITIDGEHQELLAYTVVVANSGYYGGGLHIAPAAQLDDGMLDIVVIGHASKLLFPLVLRQMRTGRHIDRPQVHTYRGSTVTLSADRDLPVYGDGDPINAPAQLRVDLRPRALAVLAPASGPGAK